jgi:predicted  nucleic acid-binding Zn-ribbon protein
MAEGFSRRFFKPAAVSLTLAAGCILFQGCIKDTAELEKEILSYDASFKTVLDKRNSMRNELAAEKAAYLSALRQINHQIDALKDQKLQARAQHASRVEKIKKKLNSEISVLQADLLDMKRNLRFKEVQLEATEKSIGEINALIKKEDTLSMTQEEMRTWNDRLASLTRKKEELVSEREKLARDIEITKTKLKVISAK